MAASTQHPSFPQPASQALHIWRYVDFPKLVAMLNSRALYFSRVDTLADKFEGSLSRMEYERWREAARSAKNQHPSPPPTFEEEYLDAMLDGARRNRRQMYVSCWHLAQHESEAMWRLYSSSEYAVAIQSEYGRLVQALPSVRFEESFVGLVTYIDHDADEIPIGNGFNPIMHKRVAFAHEKEVRAVIWRTPQSLPIEDDLERWPLGLEVPISVSDLVQRIVVSPLAPDWFADVVSSVIARYEMSFEVRRSQLIAAPYI